MIGVSIGARSADKNIDDWKALLIGAALGGMWPGVSSSCWIGRRLRLKRTQKNLALRITPHGFFHDS